MGAAGDGDSERKKKTEKFVNFTITAVLAFNRRGFVIRRGSVIVAVAWRRRRRRRRVRDRASLIILKVFFRRNGWLGAEE